jgi:hypothetical protein
MDQGRKIIQNSLQRRKEALVRHRARMEAYLITKATITNDIEEARKLWSDTLKQLPAQPFSQ